MATKFNIPRDTQNSERIRIMKKELVPGSYFIARPTEDVPRLHYVKGVGEVVTTNGEETGDDLRRVRLEVEAIGVHEPNARDRHSMALKGVAARFLVLTEADVKAWKPATNEERHAFCLGMLEGLANVEGTLTLLPKKTTKRQKNGFKELKQDRLAKVEAIVARQEQELRALNARVTEFMTSSLASTSRSTT